MLGYFIRPLFMGSSETFGLVTRWAFKKVARQGEQNDVLE
jgi:hypothetical protein